jgi:hypothetical protein
MRLLTNRLHEPRTGIVGLTAICALLMGAHWRPLLATGVVALSLTIFAPKVAVRPSLWWLMAGVWLAAIVAAPVRMEDHVFLFAVWLVALAMSLQRARETDFLDSIAWQARMLIGATFTIAVAWKIYFGEFVSGMAMWSFAVVDRRFLPIASLAGQSSSERSDDHQRISDLLSGSITTVTPGSSAVINRLAVIAVVALLLETLVALSYLAEDSSRLAPLRLPSLAVFGALTYAIVPVMAFAALLSTLAIATTRWRREAMWIFPLLLLVAVTRLLSLQLR